VIYLYITLRRLLSSVLIIFSGAALTVRPGNEKEHGLGQSTNNTRRSSSTSLPLSDQRRTILSEAGLNRTVARIEHTTEHFNGILIQSDPQVAKFV
jgi:hypothetical protein